MDLKKKINFKIKTFFVFVLDHTNFGNTNLKFHTDKIKKY